VARQRRRWISGQLVVDEIVLGIIRERLAEAATTERGFHSGRFFRAISPRPRAPVDGLLATLGKAAFDAVLLFEGRLRPKSSSSAFFRPPAAAKPVRPGIQYPHRAGRYDATALRSLRRPSRRLVQRGGMMRERHRTAPSRGL